MFLSTCSSSSDIVPLSHTCEVPPLHYFSGSDSLLFDCSFCPLLSHKMIEVNLESSQDVEKSAFLIPEISYRARMTLSDSRSENLSSISFIRWLERCTSGWSKRLDVSAHQTCLQNFVRVATLCAQARVDIQSFVGIFDRSVGRGGGLGNSWYVVSNIPAAVTIIVDQRWW